MFEDRPAVAKRLQWPQIMADNRSLRERQHDARDRAHRERDRGECGANAAERQPREYGCADHARGDHSENHEQPKKTPEPAGARPPRRA